MLTFLRVKILEEQSIYLVVNIIFEQKSSSVHNDCLVGVFKICFQDLIQNSERHIKSICLVTVFEILS